MTKFTAEDEADHYNDFNVGATMLVARDTPHGHREYATFSAANMKPHRDVVKLCAERIAFACLRKARWTHVVAIVVCGPPRKEDTTATLWPCEVCRPWLDAMPEIDDDTILLCAHNGTEEEMSWGKLMELHPEDRRCSDHDE
ncbi:MAG: hypothetical protein HYY51_00135 [Candidatus Magasanikbacteria bacterium]|nr:hypothetical protein [Candidatus Magasanikbacteria bacterium]